MKMLHVLAKCWYSTVGVRGVVGVMSRLSRTSPDGKVRRYVFPIQSGEAGLRFVAA